MPYTPGRGGLLTFIHAKYAFPGNVTKIPTPTNISPYLQIIKINNHPLIPWLIIHMYMPTHLEDTHLIPHLMNEITNQINTHPNHIYIHYAVTLIETLHLGADKITILTPLHKKKITIGKISPRHST